MQQLFIHRREINKNCVASASVRDGFAAQTVLFAPEYASEDEHQIRSLILSRDCEGSAGTDCMAPTAQNPGTDSPALVARDGKSGTPLWT